MILLPELNTSKNPSLSKSSATYSLPMVTSVSYPEPTLTLVNVPSPLFLFTLVRPSEDEFIPSITSIHPSLLKSPTAQDQLCSGAAILAAAATSVKVPLPLFLNNWSIFPPTPEPP